MNGQASAIATALQARISALAMAVAAAAAVLAILLFFIALAIDHHGLIYASMALIAFLMPASAGLMRGARYDIFEPINLIAGAILFGTTLRAFYLLLSGSSRAEFVMWGSTFEAVTTNLPWMMLGIAALVIGYVAVPARFRVERLAVVRTYAISSNRLWLCIGLICAVGLLGTYLFMNRFDISLAEGLLSQSKKRAILLTSASGDTVYGTGYERMLGMFPQYAFFLLAAVMIAGLLPARGRYFAALGGLFLASAFVPFLASQRSAIIIPLINLAIVGFYYGRVKFKTMFLMIGLTITIIAAMGFIRGQNSGENSYESVTDTVLGSGNGIDLVRTSSIMDRVPAVRPHQNGRSYLALFTFAIPREMWPDKPNVSMGPWVKSELYGLWTRTNGWPPGLIAEAHINFGRWGIIPVMLLFGFMLRVFYETCRPMLGVSLLVTAVYSAAIMRIGFTTIGANLAQGLTQTMLLAVPMLIVMLLAKAPARRARPVRGLQPARS